MEKSVSSIFQFDCICVCVCVQLCIEASIVEASPCRVYKRWTGFMETLITKSKLNNYTFFTGIWRRATRQKIIKYQQIEASVVIIVFNIWPKSERNRKIYARVARNIICSMHRLNYEWIEIFLVKHSHNRLHHKCSFSWQMPKHFMVKHKSKFSSILYRAVLFDARATSRNK